MSATPAQLDKLDAFVAAESRTQPWANHGRQAVLEVRVTEKFRAWLIYRPEGVKEGKDEWSSELITGNFLNDPAQSFQGADGDCAVWINRRHRELKALSSTGAGLEQFAAGRPKWRFYDDTNGKFYAGRRFEYTQVGEEVLLAVQPGRSPRVPLNASLNVKFSAGPEGECAGAMGEVEPWITGWERCLLLPYRLELCHSENQAQHMIETSGPGHVASLGYLFDLSGDVIHMRRRLIEIFCQDLN